MNSSKKEGVVECKALVYFITSFIIKSGCFTDCESGYDTVIGTVIGHRYFIERCLFGEVTSVAWNRESERRRS